jgi:hypothetical protein
MRRFIKIKKVIVVSLAILMIPVSASPASKVTPGGTCKVLSQKVTYSQKIYTCIKSGKKLVWSKGVSLPVPKSTKNSVVLESWVSVRNKKLNELQIILNYFRNADQYKDASLFSTSCGKLSNFISTLPGDTPLINDLRLAETFCSGSFVPLKISEWINNSEVRGFSECATPKFKALFVRTFNLNNVFQIIEFDYTNAFSEPVSVSSVMTNYPGYRDTEWDGISEANAEKLSSVEIKFLPNETKRIRVAIEPYVYSNFQKEGRGEPFIKFGLTQLLDPKYGGFMYCAAIKAQPLT